MKCRTNEVSDQWGVGPMRCRENREEIPSCLVQPTGESPDIKNKIYSKYQCLLQIKYHDIYMHFDMSIIQFPSILQGVNMHFYAKCTSMFIIKAKYLCSTASFIKVITISWGLLLYITVTQQQSHLDCHWLSHGRTPSAITESSLLFVIFISPSSLCSLSKFTEHYK